MIRECPKTHGTKKAHVTVRENRHLNNTKGAEQWKRRPTLIRKVLNMLTENGRRIRSTAENIGLLRNIGKRKLILHEIGAVTTELTAHLTPETSRSDKRE